MHILRLPRNRERQVINRVSSKPNNRQYGQSGILGGCYRPRCAAGPWSFCGIARGTRASAVNSREGRCVQLMMNFVSRGSSYSTVHTRYTSTGTGSVLFTGSVGRFE